MDEGLTQDCSQSSVQYNPSKQCGTRPFPFWSIYQRCIPIHRPTELYRHLERNREDELSHQGDSCEPGNRRLPERARRVRIQSLLFNEFLSVTLSWKEIQRSQCVCRKRRMDWVLSVPAKQMYV